MRTTVREPVEQRRRDDSSCFCCCQDASRAPELLHRFFCVLHVSTYLPEKPQRKKPPALQILRGNGRLATTQYVKKNCFFLRGVPKAQKIESCWGDGGLEYVKKNCLFEVEAESSEDCCLVGETEVLNTTQYVKKELFFLKWTPRARRLVYCWGDGGLEY